MAVLNNIKQSGAVIMEALLAFVVLGVGVAALLYMQGELMSGSTHTKARAEAMEIAKDRMELWRNYVERNQYSTEPSLPTTNIQGVNAVYTVTYAPSSLPSSTTDFKETKLTVTVSWEGSEVDEGTGNPVVKQVTLESDFYFMDPSILVAIEDGKSDDSESAFPLISPWITGVEEEHPSTERIRNSDGSTEENITLAGGIDPINKVSISRITGPGTGGEGNLSNVEVKDVDGKVVLTSFGGIVHRIRGKIYIDEQARSTLDPASEEALIVLSSPPAYCVFPICDEDGYDVGGLPLGDCNATYDGHTYEVGSYVCYVPGDCTYGSSDAAKLDDETRCPENFIPPEDDVFDDLNGGWYGKVGNLSVHLDPDDKVCTTDTNVGGGSTLHLTPARIYTTNRCVYSEGGTPPDDDAVECLMDPIPVDGQGSQIISYEGINTPYNGQHFYINRKAGADCVDAPADFGLGLKTVDEHIQRVLVGPTDAAGNPLKEDAGWKDNKVQPKNKCEGGQHCPPLP